MKTLDMPSFGADMETGKVVEWSAKPGDTLKKGDTIALIETAKGIIDMEVFEDCIVGDYLVGLDEDIEVGKPIVSLKDVTEPDGGSLGKAAVPEPEPLPETAPRPEPVSGPETEPDKRTAEVESAVQTETVSASSIDGLLVTPAAKKRATELGFNTTDLKDMGIKATGASGAICLADIEALAADRANVSDVAARTKPGKKASGFDTDMMRKAIAAVVTKSKKEIPHYYLSLDIDLTEAEQWLSSINSERDPEERLMINVPIMCAVARALRKNPEFNGFYKDGAFTPAPDVHLGLAIRLRNKGLISPAIQHADKLDAFEMMSKFKSVVERAKLGGIKQSELQDVTTTLSNIGDRGSDQIFGVIFPPQVAIIGVGKVGRKAWAFDDSIESRTVVNVSLSADHRVTDGQMGSRFLNEINKQLQKPAKFAGGAE